MRNAVSRAALALAVAVSVAPALHAQLPIPQFGVTAGLNLSTISGGTQGTETRSYHPDFMGGVTGIFPMGGVGLQVEALYSRQGVKISDQGVTGAIKISYITVPVLLRFDFGAPLVQPKAALYVGGYGAVKAGCSAEFTQGSQTESDDCTPNGADIPVKSTDFGAIAGGELTFGQWSVFARYSMGLTSIDDSKTGAEDIKNRVITLGGRWTLPLVP